MVENFEDITAPLTEDEYKVLPFIVAGLERRTRDNPVKSKEIEDAVNARLSTYGVGPKFKLSGARLRKVVNHIRQAGIIPVIATSSGYYTTQDPEDIKSNIRSLEDRAAAILAAAQGLKNFLPGQDNNGGKTIEEVLATQVVKIAEFKAKREEDQEVIKAIKRKFFNIGGPLNDNSLNFNRDQLTFLLEVQDLFESLSLYNV